jgi:hypothetical protein
MDMFDRANFQMPESCMVMLFLIVTPHGEAWSLVPFHTALPPGSRRLPFMSQCPLVTPILAILIFNRPSSSRLRSTDLAPCSPEGVGRL